MPQMTGTRPAATDFAVSMTATFSERSSEVFSPTVPQTMRPGHAVADQAVHHLGGGVDVERVVVAELRRHGGEHALPANTGLHCLISGLLGFEKSTAAECTSRL